MTTERFVRICGALATAAMLDEKAQENPDQAPKLTDLERKLRLGVALLEAQVREATPARRR